MKGTRGSFPSVLCVVLEASEAHEDLLQGDLAHGVVLQAILLFGFLQGPKDLQGKEGRDTGSMARREETPRATGGAPGSDREHRAVRGNLQVVARKAEKAFFSRETRENDTFPGRRVRGSQEYLTPFKNICYGYDCFTHLYVINAYIYTNTYIYI